MKQRPDYVLNLWKLFIIAYYLLLQNEEAFTENLQWEENISTHNIISMSCLYRCQKMDNKFQDYMKQGSKLFLNNVHDALAYYVEAANLSPKNVDIVENLAECYSKLGYHYRALDEANYMLKILPLYCFQGVYYKAKALLGLQRYNEAIRFVTTQMSIKEELKKSRDLNNLLVKLVHLEYQQRTGHYDILRLFKNDWLNEDYADYIGPVKITNIPGKGRGMMATADIHVGQLLFVHKAFSIVYQNDLDDSQWFGHNELVEAIATKLKVEPEYTDRFHKIYAGPHSPCLKDVIGNQSVDNRRINDVCSYTTIIAIMYPTANTHGIKRRGLWDLATYINHNGFDSNSFWDIFRDIMVLRAVKNIKNGEEITVTYFDPAEMGTTFEEREHEYKLHGFECSCSLCQADRNDTTEVRQKRNRILAQFKTKGFSTNDMEVLVEQLERLRPNNPELNAYILSPLKHIAENFYSKRQYNKAVETMKKAHNIAKNSPMATTAVECSLTVLNSYIAMGNREKILQWIHIVKQDLFIAYGSVDIYKVIESFTYTLESLKNINIKF